MRHAVRSLLASPSFTIGSIACLSVGLACTIAAFSAINAVLFRSMPGVRDQPRLRNIWLGHLAQYGPTIEAASPEDFAAFREALTPVADVAAYTSIQVSLRQDREPVAARAVLVSRNYFSVLGTIPTRGRLFTGDDGRDAAVVGDRFWREHLGARPDVIGEFLHVNDVTVRIAGIAPPLFVGAQHGEFEDAPERTPSVWLPLSQYEPLGKAAGDNPDLTLFARPRPGISDVELQQRADATAAALADAQPVRWRGAFTRVRPLNRGPHEEPAETAMALAVLMSVPIGILAIGCANVANLLLARASARRREIAVRLALGASRSRIVRELLAEACLLALVAAAVAIALCQAAIRATASWMPIPVATDWRVALFAILAAFVTALAFGLLPALSSSRVPLTLRIHDLRRIRPRTRRVLVAGQISLSVILLVIAALLTRTLLHVTSGQQQPDESRVVTMTFDAGLAGYDRARTDEFTQGLIERVRGLEGVEAVGFAGESPFRRQESLLVRRPDDPKERRRVVSGGEISDGWLHAAGVELLAGRDFTVQERRATPSAVLVNETLAARMAPGASALGERLLVAETHLTGTTRTELDVRIIGIVRDRVQPMTDRGPGPAAYLPSAIVKDGRAEARTLWVRARGNDAGWLAPHLRTVAAQLAPSLAMTDLMTVGQARDREAGPYKWLARGMTAMGLAGIGLAGLGLYALLAFLVSQSHRELGIRIALGARHVDIVRLVTTESLWLAAVGAAVGSGLALAIAISLRKLFFGISPGDPLSFVSAAAILILVAAIASARPALRAARTDPATILRSE